METREYRLNIRLTHAERDRLAQHAQQIGLPVSTLARQALSPLITPPKGTETQVVILAGHQTAAALLAEAGGAGGAEEVAT